MSDSTVFKILAALGAIWLVSTICLVHALNAVLSHAIELYPY